MKKITVTGVSVNMTAGDWELYTNKPGARDAAIELNRTFEDSVAAGLNADQIRKAMWVVMKKHEDLGALDSEPLYHLDVLMHKAGFTEHRRPL